MDGYNSFKHGFRVKLGGMKIEFRPASSSEIPSLPKEFVELGNSEFGATFYVTDKIKGAPDQKPDQHFRIKDCHVNCYPEYTTEALRLIAVSIYNVLACLKKLNGGKRVPGMLPGSGNWFEELCRKRTGLTNFIADMTICEEDITRFKKEEMQRVLDSKKGEIKITY